MKQQSREATNFELRVQFLPCLWSHTKAGYEMGDMMSNDGNIIARLRRAASKVMPEDNLRIRLTAHEADFLADSADAYAALRGHIDRMPRAHEYSDLEEYYIEFGIWKDVLKDWDTDS